MGAAPSIRQLVASADPAGSGAILQLLLGSAVAAAPEAAEGGGLDSLLLELLVVLLLVLFNGLLAGSEIAVVSLRRSRLLALAQGGSRAARAVVRLRENPERFLATVQIGITVVGATAGAFGGARFATDLAPVLARIEPLAPFAQELALAVVVALVSFLSLVIGELVPKSLALRAPEGYALLTGRAILALSVAARPLVWLLTASSNLLLALFGDRTTFTEARVSAEDVRLLVGEAARSGSLHPRMGEIAARAVGFGALRASDLVVPRSQMVALQRAAGPEELRRLFAEGGHGTVPVYEGSLDEVVGYVTARDLLRLSLGPEPASLEALLRPAYFVPDSKRAVDLLQELTQRRVPLAVVVDEQGGVMGLVTLADLVEELVGELGTEGAVEAPAPVFDSGGIATVPGDAPVRSVNRALGLSLPEAPGSPTIGGLCVRLAGRMPEQGEKLQADGAELEIARATPRRIREVRIRRSPAREEG